MKPTILYRVAAVLLVLFAAGHQLGFRAVDPAWNAADLARSMQTTPLPVEGFTRTYWGFYSGFGFFTTVFMLFSAVVAWQLASASIDVRRALGVSRWAFATCYATIAILTWTFFFVTPGVFATLIAIALTLAVVVPERA